MQRIDGVIQHYPWGSTTAIPRLLGRRPDGRPCAELWLGALPKAPATIGGQALTDVIATDPEGMLGTASVRAFGPRLPYLLKLLAAARPLSLQAHPDRRQAEEGFAREQAARVAHDAPDRVYVDPWPKPEMLVALEPVEALCGFRDPRETHQLFRALGVPQALDLVEPLSDGSDDALGAVVERLLRAGTDLQAVVARVVDAAATVRTDDPEVSLFARTATELGAAFPGDPGLLPALLTNRVSLRPNEGLFLPAGNLHAYLHGVGVEVMASSDNVMRGGLTAKHVAVEELLGVLDVSPSRPGPVTTTETEPGVVRYDVPVPEFALWRVETSEDPLPIPAAGSGRVVLCTAGRVGLRGHDPGNHDGSLDLVPGGAAFVRPGDRPQATGSGVIFVAAPGTENRPHPRPKDGP